MMKFKIEGLVWHRREVVGEGSAEQDWRKQQGREWKRMNGSALLML